MCSDNILSCNEPNDKSMFGGVLSEVKTRTLPAGMQGHQLSFHYICGELCMSMMGSINLTYKCFRWKYCQFLQDICGCRREDSHKLLQKNCVDSGWLLEKYWGHQSVLYNLATHHNPVCPHWGWVSCHHQPGAWLHQQWRSGPGQCCLLINKEV